MLAPKQVDYDAFATELRHGAANTRMGNCSLGDNGKPAHGKLSRWTIHLNGKQMHGFEMGQMNPDCLLTRYASIR